MFMYIIYMFAESSCISYICSLIRLGQVSLYAAMLFIPIFVSYICSLIRLGQVRLYAAMLFIPILVSYICSTIRLGQVRLYAAMLFITIFVFGVVFFTIGGHHNIRYPPRKYFRFSTKNLGPKPPTFISIEEFWVLRKSKIIQTGLVLISVLDFYHWWSPQYQVPTEKILVVTTICDTHRDNILGYKACLNNFAFSQHPNFFNAYLGWVFWSQIFC